MLSLDVSMSTDPRKAVSAAGEEGDDQQEVAGQDGPPADRYALSSTQPRVCVRVCVCQ